MLLFVEIPGGALIYAIAGLVIFAGLTLFDFQRLRQMNEPPFATVASTRVPARTSIDFAPAAAPVRTTSLPSATALVGPLSVAFAVPFATTIRAAP